MEKEIVARGRYLSLVKVGQYEMIDRVNCTGVVIVFPVTNEGQLVLCDQFRIPLGKRVIELPAGLVNDVAENGHESLEQGARRELLEETGYEAGQMRLVGEWPISSGMTSEIISFYEATQLSRKTNGGGADAEEDITVHVVDLEKLDEWLPAMEKKGYLIDPKIYSGLYLHYKRKQNL